MAYFRKRSDKWSAQVHMNGKSISKRFDSKKLARHWASMMETQTNNDNLPEIVEMTYQKYYIDMLVSIQIRKNPLKMNITALKKCKNGI